MSRADTIRSILERYAELVDPMRSGNGTGDTGVRLMPSTYTASVKQLERLMVEMRERDHSLWRHVNGRYMQCTTRIKVVYETRRNKNGKRLTEPSRKVATEWPAWVDETRVDEGVRWLAAHWPRWEPELPHELLVSAA